MNLQDAAGAIGAGRNEVMEVFEKSFKENMTQTQAINLGLKGLTAVSDKLKPEFVEVAVINPEKEFHTLSAEEVSKAVKKIK